MTSSSLRKPALFLLLSALALGSARAEPSSCPRGQTAAAPEASIANTPQFQARMRWIEGALREGRITPYDAGRLMRQVWEQARFESGFLAASPAGSGSGCGPLNPELAAKLAPLGDLALDGLQSAGSLMRTLLQETERLIQDRAAPGQAPL